VSLSKCFRCGDMSYETLRTHSYCVSCNYCDEFSYEDNSLAHLAAIVRQVVDEKNQFGLESSAEPKSDLNDRSDRRFVAALEERKEVEGSVC
jgi:predicted  nucleic acid-binding Zn-ribbon protein